MELEDGAFELLEGVVATSDPKVGFKDVDVAILVGAFPRKPGMERKDLLSQNGKIFKAQGQALNEYASRNVKVRSEALKSNIRLSDHYKIDYIKIGSCCRQPCQHQLPLSATVCTQHSLQELLRPHSLRSQSCRGVVGQSTSCSSLCCEGCHYLGQSLCNSIS